MEQEGEMTRKCDYCGREGNAPHVRGAKSVAVPRELWATISRKRIAYWDAESLETAMNIARLVSARHAAQKRPSPCRKCGETFEPRYLN